MSAADVTVRLQALDGQWETCGADRAIGVLPDTLTASSNTWGPDKASFNLARQPIAVWPDIGAYAPVEIEIGGIVVWKGRVIETPFKDGAEQQVNVQCEGMQYHLDDDVYQRAYVHSKLTDWVDTRSKPLATLINYKQSGNVQVKQGQVTLGYAKGSLVTTGQYVGVTLDLGPAGPGARTVKLEAELPAGENAAAFGVYIIGHEGFVIGGEQWTSRADFASNQALTAASISGTIGAGRRYVSILVVSNTANEERANDLTYVIKAIRVFTDSTYQTAGASVLKATNIIGDALGRATQLLSGDTSLIQSTSFNIPDFVLSKASTPREVIEAANAYHNWVTKLDLQDRLIFAPRPSAPSLEIGAWSGAETTDASANSGAEIYSRAIAEATGPDGAPLSVEKTAASETLADRRGFQRTKVLQVSSAITATEGEQIAKVFLESHTTTPFKGSAKISPGGARTVLGGVTSHPSQLLARTTELLRLAHIVDPATGGVGRDGTIAGVSYTHRDQTAQVELDERRADHEALLSRLQVIQTPGS